MVQAEHTAADYYFDSYAHFGEILAGLDAPTSGMHE